MRSSTLQLFELETITTSSWKGFVGGGARFDHVGDRGGGGEELSVRTRGDELAMMELDHRGGRAATGGQGY
jgi:hypothetical protein